MKKRLFIFLLLICLLFVGCHNANGDDKLSDDNSPTDNNILDLEDPTNHINITVRSIEELEDMREMIGCKDQDLLNDYLLNVQAGGVDDVETLETFVQLVDAIPYGELHKGNITYISYSKGMTEDTQKPYEMLYVTVKSLNGEWIRYEYLLSASDISKEIEERTDQLSTSEVLAKPAVSSDQKIKIYAETREQHPSKTGTVIHWVADVNGVFTTIVYYTLSEDQIHAADVLSNVKLSSLIQK